MTHRFGKIFLPELGMTVKSIMRMQISFEANLPEDLIPSTKTTKNGIHLLPLVHTEIDLNIKDLDGNDLAGVQNFFRKAPGIIIFFMTTPGLGYILWIVFKKLKKSYDPVPSYDSNKS